MGEAHLILGSMYNRVNFTGLVPVGQCYNICGIAGMKFLIEGARGLDIRLATDQIKSFQVYYEELHRWNQRVNLTSIVDYQETQIKHFLDSLTTSLVLVDSVKNYGRVMDIGSGGGFPGVPLKLAYPEMYLAILDSVGKKTAFLAHLVEVLGLEGAEVYTGRAEDMAHDPGLRENFDLVVSRGVAPMRVLMEITLPYCRVGGSVIALKKGDIGPEVDASRHAMDVLGGQIRETRSVNVEGLEDGRVLVVVEKVRPTPAKFPRRSGLPSKRPL